MGMAEFFDENREYCQSTLSPVCELDHFRSTIRASDNSLPGDFHVRMEEKRNQSCVENRLDYGHAIEHKFLFLLKSFNSLDSSIRCQTGQDDGNRALES